MQSWNQNRAFGLEGEVDDYYEASSSSLNRIEQPKREISKRVSASSLDSADQNSQDERIGDFSL